jgi:hypothetical protein
MSRSSSRTTRMPEIEVSGNQRQAFASAVVDHDQDAQTAAVDELIGDKIQRPAVVRPLRDQHRCPCAQGPLTTAAAADHKARRGRCRRRRRSRPGCGPDATDTSRRRRWAMPGAARQDRAGVHGTSRMLSSQAPPRRSLEHFPEKWTSGFPKKMRPRKGVWSASRRRIEST